MVGRPSFGEVVLLATLSLAPVVFWRGTPNCFEVPQAALLATGALLLGAWALTGELRRAASAGAGAWIGTLGGRLRAAALSDPLGSAILFYLASAAASTIASPHPALSLYGSPNSRAGLVTGLATAAVYFTARSLGGHSQRLVRMAVAATAAGAVATGYALIQLAGLDPFSWGGLATFAGATRVFGTLGHPNTLGAYIAMTLPLIAWLCLRSGAAARIALSLLAAASLYVLVATLSRGAWLGTAAAAAIGILLGLRARRAAPRRSGTPRRRPGRPVATLVVGTVLLAGVFALLLAKSPLGTEFVERARSIASLRAPSTQSRLEIWGAGLRMAAARPVLGAGLDAFEQAFPAYRTPAHWQAEWGGTPQRAHNEPIHILATQGVLGGLAALLVLLLAVRAGWLAIRNTDPAVRGGAAAVAASLTAFAVQDLASFTLVALGALAAAQAGWLSAAAARAAAPGAALARETQGRRGRSRGRGAWAPAAAGLASAVAFVPLVWNPLRAETLMQKALTSPDGSVAREEALTRGSALASWDARFPAALARSLLARTGGEPDPRERAVLLARARAAAERAAGIEPENGSYQALLGHVLTEQSRLDPPAAGLAEIHGAFSSARARDPFNADLLSEVIGSYLSIGQFAEGRRVALECARVYPRMAQPIALIAYVALQEGRTADAVDSLTLALDLDWHGDRTAKRDAWTNLSAAQFRLGAYDRARDAAEQALVLDPASPVAARNRDLAVQLLSAGTAKPPRP